MYKYNPKDKEELKALIADNNIYLGDIDTSLITDMSHLFSKTNRKDYSGIENWNTENVINMESTFSIFNNDFDININNWNVSKVENMKRMFSGCTRFNQPLDKWDTSKVNNMEGMFFTCIKFNQDINNWNVSNVKNMSNMFYQCKNFNQPLNKWNVSKVENMTIMFAGAYNFNKSLNDWDISNVKYMGSMFYNAKSFNNPLDKWNTIKLENISSMFYKALMFNQDLSSWNLSNVLNADSVFEKSLLEKNNKIPIQFIVAEYVTAKKKSSKIEQLEIIKNNVKEAYKSIINYNNKIYTDFKIMLENEFYTELAELKTNNDDAVTFNNIEDIENFVNNHYDKKNNTKLKFIGDIIKEKEIKVFDKDKSKIISDKIIKYIYLQYFNLKKYIYKIQTLDNIINFLDETSFKNCIREIYFNSKKNVSTLVCGIYTDDNMLIEMYNRENSSLLFMKILALHTDSKFALSLLYNVFARNKKSSIKKESIGLLNSIAEKMNLELYELGFKVVYDFGFNKRGEKIIEVNDNKYKISLKNNNTVELFDINNKKQLKSIPKNFPKNIKEEIKHIRKEIPNILKSQNYNLIKILISGKKYNYKFWKDIFIDNPIMNKYAVSLIWNLYDENLIFKTSFRYLGDSSYTDCDDNNVVIDENCYINLSSVFDLSKEDITKWKMHLNDYEISQPINQFPIINIENLDKSIKKLQNMEIVYSSLKAFTNRYSMNAIYEFSESIFYFADFKKDKFTIKIEFDEYISNGDIVKIDISFTNSENKMVENRFIYYWLVLMIIDFKKEELFY
ncbi:BspA family leucine-rich repeat surface protein [Brachyspira alvinipulli]|uniref:BspA family leucine-rich repeat surface protein n=1 Tax=Brachyspira alvinipulli TaxID=84379 RepID=UPI0030065ED4